jgi:MipA family protein
MKLAAALPIALVLLGSVGLAHAQTEFYRRITPPGASSGGVVGAAVLVGREYQGSNESRVRVLPGIDYQWGNGFFAGTLNGIGYNASSRSDLAYGIRITPDFGRRESRSTVLRGLGNIEARPEIGAFFNISPMANVVLSSSLRYGSGNDRNGLLLDLGAGWSTALTQNLRFGTNLAATWANTDYMKERFGISAAQAARSGYATYSPGSGVRDVRLGMSLVYRFNPQWSLTSFVNHSVLTGDSRRSPIVREQGTTSAAFVLGYSF